MVVLDFTEVGRNFKLFFILRRPKTALWADNRLWGLCNEGAYLLTPQSSRQST